VLSATSQSSTVDDVIRQHGSNRSIHCVLTHLDACARLGEIFNAIIRHHLPIAYWSDSASIQKPLQKADASVLIATAVAMSRRLSPTPDDECLLSLIQPSDHLMSKHVDTKNKFEVMS
jgi:flagellar biosynthesis GTPase FlhF